MLIVQSFYLLGENNLLVNPFWGHCLIEAECGNLGVWFFPHTP